MYFRESILKELAADLRFGVAEDGGGMFGRALTNRGFHALCFYRIAHRLNRGPLALIGFILTRLCQILYAIDIDPRARIAGGVIIYHGVGVVIGAGAIIESRVILFHGVTLGIKRGGRHDGFPHIESGVILGAGAKLLGRLVVGANSIVGANTGIADDIPPGSIAKVATAQVYPRSSARQPAGRKEVLL